MQKFNPQWYTVPEFAQIVPAKVYHKENQPGFTELPVPKNMHVLARTAFFYTAKLGRIKVCITADDYYKLYINGRFAGQGPAPAYPEKYYFNEIDITPYLKNGQNILAVHLYYQGLVNRVWNSGDGRFGVACQVRDEAQHVWEPSWRFSLCRAYSGETTGYQAQYLENFDSRLWEEDWNMTGYDDRAWKPMVPAAWADYTLYRQPVKMLDVYTAEPESIRKTPGIWQLDFGHELAGALRIRARGKSGQRVIIRCGEECTPDGRVRFDLRCNCRYEEIWTLKEGESLFEPYDYKGFRYAELLMEEGVCILDVQAVVRHYPMQEELCTVKSSAPYLEQIFQICKNGVKYATQEGYLDCITREKGQYLGDAVVTALSQVWLTGTVEMLRKCVCQFAVTAAVCPGIMAVAPGSLMQEIADFSLLLPELLLTDYKFTGDRQFLEAYYPTVKGMLAHFKQYERADGMLVRVADKWNLTDWPENLRDGYDFELSRPVVADGCHNVINALYVGAVQSVSRMETILGKKQSCDFKRLKNAYIRTFYCPRRKLFQDSETSSHTALHSNIYALYFGLCPEGSQDRIADFLIEKGMCCGVMVSYFYLKALARCGRHQDVYRMIVNESEYGWVNMIREGATACMEAWGKEQKWNTSLCHPWASAPIPVIIEDIAGFVPDPQCERGFRLEPHVPKQVCMEVKVPFRGERYVIQVNYETSVGGKEPMSDLIVKYNELTAEQFIELWETVWGDGPSLEQTRLAMEHTLFRVSVWDGDCIVAMARMNGDMGLNYYIKDVVVRPEYQRKGIGRMLINELRRFINDNGVKGTDIFVELCAVPDKIPFYEKFGFEANEAQRLKIYHRVE